jgi:hypothetical protein
MVSQLIDRDLKDKDEDDLNPDEAIVAAPAGHDHSISIDSGALRDAFLRKMSEQTVIGRLFSDAGECLHEGDSPIGWLAYFTILPKQRDEVNTLSVEEVRALWLELARKYNTAASFHANLQLAAQTLAGEVEAQEASFIKTEAAKYNRGGELWDHDQNKARERRPAKAILEDLAKASVSNLRRTLARIKSEVDFFYNIMMNLETQRRCLKEYVEILQLDPSSPRSGF